ncbi:hypothetical protein [Fusobacterium varium]|jgi:hypothetical protein|uniref:hypothetical protein n=1 Tax=Fusobacterium varium TaxID=856 RepID=UPI0020530505|nr:hypothetical protein [Fusobacterium varium]DAE89504.1 MAG TPA: hypothetical protein [Caudoviricetes sp.]
MGILTNFLKLLKPEPNDFVDVAKHISENYDKLDQNAKSNNETLTNLSTNKLDKGTYSGNASNLKAEIDKVASTTQLGRIKVGTNLRIDENGFLHGNPAVDISGKIDKYKDVTSIISDYDDIIEDGFYIARGSERGTINAPFHGAALVQVWNYGGFVYQNAVSYYNVQSQFTRCFEKGIKNTKWEKIVNTTDIVNNLTTTVPEKVLDARQGPAIVNKINGLAGGYSGTFPLTTAVKEGIYLLPATNKFYVCIKNYSGSSLTAPNANFEELSVFQNRNKLENLFTFEEKNRYTSLSNFDYINATIYKISKLCICYIRYEYQGVLPKIKIPFPITFVRPPIVTMVDNDTEMGSAYNNIAIGWPTTSDVEVKGTIQGATLILIGQFIS